MIKTQKEIPLITRDDIINPDRLEILLTTIKQYAEELALKAQSTQEEVRGDAPRSEDIEEGEIIPSLESGTYKMYRKISGAIKSVTMT